MDKLRIAIMGSGGIAHVHARACQAAANVELVAAANWRPESLQRFAERWAIPRTYLDFDQLAADPGVDAVIVTLPNFLHAPESIRMLFAGKHVLCEKPMALNATQAAELLYAAEETDRTLMIGHMWRFDPEVNWLRNCLNDGLIGKVIKTQGYHLNPPFFGPVSPWMVQQEPAGGGAVIDMSIHSIDTTRYLLGDPLPLKVFARMGTHYSPHSEVEDEATFMVTWNNGTYSVFVTANFNPYQEAPEGAIEVWGVRGHGRLFPSALDLPLGGTMGRFAPTFAAREQQVDYPMFQKQVEHFADCILTGRRPEPGPGQGLIDMRIVDAVYASASSGGAVDVS